MSARQRVSVAALAKERGISVKQLIKDAIEEGGNIHAASVLLGIADTNVKYYVQKFNLEITQKTVVRERRH